MTTRGGVYGIVVCLLSWLLLAACGGAGGKPAGGTTTPPPGGGGGGDGAAAGGERRWVYSAALLSDEGDSDASHEVALVETGRGEVGGVRVIEMAVYLDGALITEEAVESFSSAPFPIFGPKLALLVGTAQGQQAVWMTFLGADGQVTAELVAEARQVDPEWLLGAESRKPRPAADAEIFDAPFRYAAKVGSWDSACTGFIHPAPESGDYYESESCFAPEVGITRLVFESVWGGYRLELMSAPAGFSL